MRTSVVGVALVVALVGCGAAEQDVAVDEGRASPPSPAALPTASVGPIPGQAAQTWPEPYAETSCDEWNADMGEIQWQTASAEMLVASRRARGIEELPAPPLVSRFTSAIDGRCTSGSAGSTTIAEVARDVFSDDATKEGAARQWQ